MPQVRHSSSTRPQILNMFADFGSYMVSDGPVRQSSAADPGRPGRLRVPLQPHTDLAVRCTGPGGRYRKTFAEKRTSMLGYPADATWRSVAITRSRPTNTMARLLALEST